MKKAETSFEDLQFILYRNLCHLTNAIIFSVVFALFYFGDFWAGLFLGTLAVLNLVVGLFQDIHAWNSLRKLQLLTAPLLTRITSDGTHESVFVGAISKGDLLLLKLGEQVPCDGVLVEASRFELNEGLITGESTSLPREVGTRLLAGSIVTCGFGTLRVETAFKESRISKMTSDIKKYALNESPIQQSVDTVIQYCGYVLIGAIVSVVLRGRLVGEAPVDIVLNIGTLASILVPQGLVFAITLFFAYGAATLFKRNVLLKEVNATEKLGRVKNLCMDKTGTITENTFSVKEMLLGEGLTREDASALTLGYLEGTGDSSQTVEAVRRFLVAKYKGSVIESLPFSSWRQYGAARLDVGMRNSKKCVVYAGPIQIFLPHIKDASQRERLEKMLHEYEDTPNRMLCFFMGGESMALDDLDGAELSLVAVYVFENKLREGIKSAIDFFQKRGTRLRIISGDNPGTASAIAVAAGIHDSDKVVTGGEIKEWSDSSFVANVQKYAIFASVLPEQKKKIIDAFKTQGYTAMIGDGANDALAIKSADLGIAMFDGTPAVRQLASVVLTSNSFAALPGGVELADTVIRSIEMFSSMFFNQTLIAFFFFLITSLVGHEYPLTPFSITLINYCAIGIPGILISSWLLYPEEHISTSDARSFLERTLAFATASALVQSVGVGVLFAYALLFAAPSELSTIIVASFIAFGLLFFVCVPYVYQGRITDRQQWEMGVLLFVESALLFCVLHVTFLKNFFSITFSEFTFLNALHLIGIFALFGFAQIAVARIYAKRISH